MENGEKVVLNYIKTGNFETKFVSGVYGGMTPNQLINMNVFIDRLAIPQKQVFEIENNNIDPNKPLEIAGKEGLVREVHTGLLFNAETAKTIVGWLNQFIEKIEENK